MTAPRPTIRYDRVDGQWAWRCDGCWVGTGHPSYWSAREEARRHINRDHGGPASAASQPSTT